MTYEMPTRTDVDGGVSVTRLVQTAPPHDETGFCIEGTHKGQHQSMVLSRYNAARILVLLCMMLEVEPPKDLIKMPL